jgi:hypothetical protein
MTVYSRARVRKGFSLINYKIARERYDVNQSLRLPRTRVSRVIIVPHLPSDILQCEKNIREGRKDECRKELGKKTSLHGNPI